MATVKVFWKNLRCGVGMGLVMAGVFAAYVSFLFLVNGDRLRAKYDTTWLTVMVAYFGCGLFGGLVLGLLRPLARWSIGEGIIGFFIGVVFSLMMATALDGFTVWNDLHEMMVMAVVFGCAGSIVAVMSRIYAMKKLESQKVKQHE